MQDLKRYKTAINQTAFYKKNSDHTQEELDALAKNIPVKSMQDANLFAQYCRDSGLSGRDCGILLRWAMSQKPFTDNITVQDGVTFQKALECYEPVRIGTIILHRVNYILHESICSVYSLVDDKLRFESRKAQKTAEEFWDKNLSGRQRMIEHAAFVTMLDHLRLVNDAVKPYIDKVYAAVRDFMIYLEYKDVEVKARCAIVFLMAKVAGNTREAFFKDFEKEYGINYSECFKGDDMRPMVDAFASMCDLIGIPTEKDQYGYWRLTSFNPEENLQFKGAWKKIMSVLRDDDLMDETAQQAICMNPAIKEDYERVVAEEQERKVREGIELLSDKYKVRTA